MKKKIKVKKSPIILGILASIGVVATAVMAINATLKFTEIPDKVADGTGAISEKEFRMETMRIFTPVVAIGSATILCIVSSTVIGYKNQKALFGAYIMASNLYKEYRKNAIEIGGEELDKEICEAMARQNCGYHCINLDVPDMKVIFYDEISGRSKECYEREIMDAEYHLNRNYTLRGYATLNEWYEFVGWPPTKEGEKYGWDMDGGIMWVDIEHRLINRDDGGTPVYSIDYIYGPWELDELYLS